MLGELNELVTLNPRRGALSFFTQAFCLFSKTLIERRLLSETAALLHGAAPFRERKAGAQAAVSSPIDASYAEYKCISAHNDELKRSRLNLNSRIRTTPPSAELFA
jgi:hypothetical protein